MKVAFTDPFLRHLKKLPELIRRKFEKQLSFLLRAITHPSLHAKKHDEERDIWQARVNGSYRFYFQIKNDTYIILNILKHPK